VLQGGHLRDIERDYHGDSPMEPMARDMGGYSSGRGIGKDPTSGAKVSRKFPK